MSQAKSTFGASIYRESAIGSGLYTVKVAEVVEFKVPGLKRNMIEVTNHDTADNFKEWIKSLCELGDATCKVNWIESDASHNSTTGLISDFFEDDLYGWRFVTKSGAYMQAKGAVSDMGGAFPTAAAQQLDITFKMSGAPSFSGI